jgi:class 3 adenylate cyclase
MTKGTPYQLYVADSTRSALRQPVGDLVEAGEFEVRGRKAKVKLWSLAASTDNAEASTGNGASGVDVEPATTSPQAEADPRA